MFPLLQFRGLQPQKLLTTVLLPLSLVLALWGWMMIRSENRFLIDQMEKRAHTISRTFARSNTDAMLSYDYPVVQTNVEMVGQNDPEVLGIDVIQEGKKVASYQQPGLATRGDATKNLIVRDEISFRGQKLGQIEVTFSTAEALQKLRWRVATRIGTIILLFLVLSSLLFGMLKKMILVEAELVQSEKMAALGQLLAGLAHELNNPLNFIYANLELLHERVDHLKNTPDFQELKKIMEEMEEGANRAKAIIDDFRFFSQPGQGEIGIVSLSELLDHSLRLLKPKWQNRIEIKKECPSSLRVKGSVTELGQVFVNLLSNACDAIADKGFINIFARETSGQVEVQIEDSGIGISADKIGKIFDPFYTTKASGKGIGLGLAISSQIIKKHEGTIEAKSRLGEGSEFIVRLPL